jgi:hypothetical protein
MALLCTQPPALEPVSLSELKDMLRIDPSDTTQDDVLMGLNSAARAWCETVTQRRFVQQTWQLTLDFFPGYIDMKLAGQKVSSPFVSGSNAVLVGIRYAIVLPYPPVFNFETFTYIAANGDTVDMFNGSDNPADWAFQLDTLSQPARVMPIFGQMWPVAKVVANALQMTFTVGYATPISVVTSANVAVLGGAYDFTAANVGQPISIIGAGANGTTLNTVISSVSGSTASVRDIPSTTLSSGTPALLVNNGIAAHWELLKSAIKVLVNAWFVNRLPSYDAASRDAVKALLMPVCDVRL